MSDVSEVSEVSEVYGGGIKISGQECKLEDCKHEAREVNWENFNVSKVDRWGFFVSSVLFTIGGCLLWTVIFYIPYAHYLASFSYANGDKAGVFSEGIFCSLVVGSQRGLCFLSNIAAVRTRFRYTDSKDWMYKVLYNSALILNFQAFVVRCLQELCLHGW